MKLYATQIILGVLIILASCYIIGWMILGVTSLLNMTLPDESGVMRTNVFPEHENLFITARYASGLLLVFGIAALLIGSFQKRGESRKKLAIMQTITGMLIIATSVFILRWGYALKFIVPIEDGNLSGFVNINPGPLMVYAVWLTTLATFLGLVITGVGIAQFIRARK